MPKDRELTELARVDAESWKQHGYYDQAEQWMEMQWSLLVWPIIRHADLSHVVDLACGHGRNTAKLLDVAERVTLVDIHKENIDFCRKRFAAHGDRVQFVVNNGTDLAGIKTGSATLVYCFDAMVHFDSDVVRSYLRETRRVLRIGGHAFFHHSAYTGNPAGSTHDNPHVRAFMSPELFHHWAHKEGLTVVHQQTLDWGDRADGSWVEKLDCVTGLLSRSGPK
jgi:ubiquinone/menaquinone biosynthesis C-methylase UbiE